MTNMKKYIKNLREKSLIDVSVKAEKLILERLGENGCCEDDEGRIHAFSAQDIWEQCRKIIEANPPRIDIPDFLKSETEKAGF